MIDINFWDKFYTDLENGLTKYTRPADWQERTQKAESTRRNIVKNQYDGRNRGNHEYK